MVYWTIGGFVAFEVALAATGGLLTDVGPWYENLRKPSWNPPNWAFGPAWTLILGLAGWAGVLAWDAAGDSAGHVKVAAYFLVNGLLHAGWSLCFFKLKRPDVALIEVGFLWLSILAMVFGLAAFSTLAGWLIVPYLLWVAFAAYLNWTIVRLNPRRMAVSSAA